MNVKDRMIIESTEVQSISINNIAPYQDWSELTTGLEAKDNIEIMSRKK